MSLHQQTGHGLGISWTQRECGITSKRTNKSMSEAIMENVRAVDISWNESWRDVAKLGNHRSDPPNTEGHVWSAQANAWGF